MIMQRTAALALAAALGVVAFATPASAAQVTHARDFLGTWVGDGHTQVKIAKDGPRLTVRLWGDCGDERCVIGEFTARRYATSVQDGSRGTVALKGVRVPSFATVTYLLTLRDGALVMQQTYDYTGDRQDSYEEFTLQRT